MYGGTYMLHKSDAKVEFDEAGKAVGVSSEGETAKCKFVVGDGSYFPGKTRLTSRVVRALCILSHPIPSTDNAHSAQIILPQQQVGRKSGEARGFVSAEESWGRRLWRAVLCACAPYPLQHMSRTTLPLSGLAHELLGASSFPYEVLQCLDTLLHTCLLTALLLLLHWLGWCVCLCADMYVFCCSYAHNVAANNKWLAFVSTTVETSTPELELAPGLALLGPIDEKFVEVVDIHAPLADGRRCGWSHTPQQHTHTHTRPRPLCDFGCNLGRIPTLNTHSRHCSRIQHFCSTIVYMRGGGCALTLANQAQVGPSSRLIVMGVKGWLVGGERQERWQDGEGGRGGSHGCSLATGRWSQANQQEHGMLAAWPQRHGHQPTPCCAVLLQ